MRDARAADPRAVPARRKGRKKQRKGRKQLKKYKKKGKKQKAKGKKQGRKIQGRAAIKGSECDFIM